MYKNVWSIDSIDIAKLNMCEWKGLIRCVKEKAYRRK